MSIHTCSYSCERPACIKAQRDELAQKMFELVAEAVAAEREKVAAWMRARSYATGHGDTIEDLLKELEWQVAERVTWKCAEIAEAYEPTCDVCPKGVADAIRARGEI